MKLLRLVLSLLLLPGCQKTGPAPVDPLPSATQTGANTFGCLLNGQPWTPRGSNGTDNYKVIYDAGYAGGSLDIRAYRYPPGQTDNQYIGMGGAPIAKPGIYSLDGTTAGVYYSSGIKGPCFEYYNAPGLVMKGQLTVTRLDLRAGIVAGTFAFTLSQPGCDTVKVTQGRFDKKL